MLISAKLYIPDSLEEARQIIPGIDTNRFEKWRREGAVELVLEEVYACDRPCWSVIVDIDEAYCEGVLAKRYSVKEYLKWCRYLEPDEDGFYTLFPTRYIHDSDLQRNHYYILVTEEVNMPPNLLPFDVSFRSTFHRFGWIGRVSNIDPGFRGRLHVLLWAPEEAPMLKIRKGARIIQVRFLKLEKTLEGYRGQWQDT